MTDALRDQLQTTLNGAYTLERELGGGGMSHVFVANETRLGRRVVIKVLSSELAAGISAERFEREIKLAASLQQANIVPVLSAGDANGLPFYTMPFVEGESLRARLAKRPTLATTDIIRILGDVARALQYAYERGIVHRDIKPDNVLLSGGTAVVTDFGIAKALSASRTGSAAGATLTQFGTSIGTPAYMAPEQAAGDPDVDHRADIYAFGCMAYEILAGHPPFHGRTPQRVLAAHMGETPTPIAELRPDIPASLAGLVMRCLAKDASERPQTPAEIVHALDSVTSGSGMVAMPPALLQGPGAFRKALLVYVASAVAVAVIAKAATTVVGLPDWVFSSAILVMLIGLPVILFTGYVQAVARRTLNATPALTPGGSALPRGTMSTIALKASPHLSWKRMTRGGILALGAFVAVVLGFMVTRALGIGPAASLFAKGVMKEQDRVLVADFEPPATDTSLGSVVSEGVRSNLTQSRAITIVRASQVSAALVRMQKPRTTRLDLATAREIAQREGYKAVVDGTITSVSGGQFIITVRIVAAESGDELASFREVARDAAELIPAIDRVTKALRGKLGESLTTVRATPSLARVTTSSLAALRKYTEGVRSNNVEQNFLKAIAAHEEAIKLDSTFALAYRAASISYSNAGLNPERTRLYREKAFQYRDRLPEVERALVEASYYDGGGHADRQKAILAYRRVIEADPTNAGAMNNLGLLYVRIRDYARAESLYRAAIAVDSTAALHQSNLVDVLASMGKTDEALAAWNTFRNRFPRSPTPGLEILASKYGIDSVRVECAKLRKTENLQLRATAENCVSMIDLTQGHVLLALAAARRFFDTDSARGRRNVGFGLAYRFREALATAWFLGRKEDAARAIDAIAARIPLVNTPPAMEAAPPQIVLGYTVAGRPDKARGFFEKWTSALDTTQRRLRTVPIRQSQARIAAAEKRYDEAIREFLAADTAYDGYPTACASCTLPELGYAYDLAGRRDQAIATFEKYLAIPPAQRWASTDPIFLAGIFKRLGELYEEKNDLAKAASYYGKFIDLWKDADPELQPRVAEAKTRLAQIQKREAR